MPMTITRRSTVTGTVNTMTVNITNRPCSSGNRGNSRWAPSTHPSRPQSNASWSSASRRRRMRQAAVLE